MYLMSACFRWPWSWRPPLGAVQQWTRRCPTLPVPRSAVTMPQAVSPGIGKARAHCCGLRLAQGCGPPLSMLAPRSPGTCPLLENAADFPLPRVWDMGKPLKADGGVGFGGMGRSGVLKMALFHPRPSQVPRFSPRGHQGDLGLQLRLCTWTKGFVVGQGQVITRAAMWVSVWSSQLQVRRMRSSQEEQRPRGNHRGAGWQLGALPLQCGLLASSFPAPSSWDSLPTSGKVASNQVG